MKNPVLIFGANYLGRIAKEIFESNEVVIYGFLDDDVKLHNTELDEASILGSTDDDGFLKLVGKKCEAFVAIDDNKLRKHIVKMLNEVRHVQPVNAIHHQVSLSKIGELGHGNLVDAGFFSGPGSRIGSHCILGAKSYLGPGSSLGDFVQLGAGALLNQGVKVEDEVFIGSGAVIVAGIAIGKGARIGAGSVVIGPVKAGETVFGNPAQPIKA